MFGISTIDRSVGIIGSQRGPIDMALVTAFDTETTGLLPKQFSMSPANLPKLPHIVQLASILFDTVSGEEQGSFNVIVKPEGYVVPPESSAIHGITHEQAMDEGVPLSTAVEMFSSFKKQSKGMIAHNIEYDMRIMAIAFARLGLDGSEVLRFPKKCTMKASTEICKIPGNWGYKWPKLGEAYKIFFDEELEGAHDALVDIRATVRIYRHLRGLGVI